MYKPLRNCKNDYIWYSQKPPRLGGIPQKISIDDFMNIFYVPQGGERFEYTETLWYSSNKLELRLESKLTTQARALNSEVLRFLDNPNTDKMVISFIDKEVGFGVFAREKIAYGEVVAVYSGTLLKKDNSTNRLYAFVYDNNFSIDAAEKGGIARFFQQLPYSRKRHSEFTEKMRSDRDLMQMELKLQGIIDLISPLLGGRTLAQLDQKTFSLIASSLSEGPLGVNWFMDSIALNNPSLEERIAFLNLKMDWTIEPITQLPICFFYAEYDIEPGEQLGITYGCGYWFIRDVLPKLFDTRGTLISSSEYHYTKMKYLIGLSDKNESLYLTKKDVDKNIELQKPVSLNYSKYSVQISFFKMRDRLVNYGMLPEAYAQLPPNSFSHNIMISLEKQKKIFSSRGLLCEITCKLYWHNPEATIYLEQQTVDALLNIDMKITIFYKMIKEIILKNKIKFVCKFHDEIQEIIFLGINLPKLVSDFQEFSLQLPQLIKALLEAPLSGTLLEKFHVGDQHE